MADGNRTRVIRRRRVDKKKTYEGYADLVAARRREAAKGEAGQSGGGKQSSIGSTASFS